MSNEINLLKIAYRNVWVSLSFQSLANSLRTNKAFQQTFLTQLTIYNFLFDSVKENGNQSVFVNSNNQTQNLTNSFDVNNLDEFCRETNFSLASNNSLDFLGRFNTITSRKCVIKELTIRSVDLNDMTDDLHYFSVFVQNSLHLKVDELQPRPLIELNDTKNAGSENEVSIGGEHPSYKDFATMGRSNWIEQRTMAQFLGEVMENKVYIYKNKPKSIIILKWIAIVMLGIAMVVNGFLSGLILFLSFTPPTSANSGNLNSIENIWFILVGALVITTYIFFKEISSLLMSIKGDGISMPFLWGSIMLNSRISGRQKKMHNNDNIRFYFNWKGIFIFALLTLLFLVDAVSNFFKYYSSLDTIKVIDYVAGIIFLITYGAILLITIVAMVINPKQNFALIRNRQNEIREEIVNQINDDDSAATPQQSI